MSTSATSDVKPKTILVVDDDDQVRTITTKILDLNGYNIVEAENGEEALRRFESLSADIDLVLTDITMPGMSGYELAERLTAHCPPINILFMSGYIPTMSGENPKPATCRPHLSKPFTTNDLLQIVQETLNVA